MAWLDDRAWCHPKILPLSDRAFRVWVNSISYSAGMGLRGVLAESHQRFLGASRQVRSELLDAGLWDELLDGSVAIHDWKAHNGKRDERREKDRERKRAARADSPQEVPQGIPQDVPADTPQERRALKEVKEVTAVEPNGSTGRKREQDPLWGALTEVFGEARTDSARSIRGKVCRSLAKAGATPDEIVQRAKAWPRHFDHATLTETALEKHWGALARKPLRLS